VYEAALIALYVFVSACTLALSWLNLSHQRRVGDKVPLELAEAVDAERLAKSAAYTRARARLDIVTSLLSTSAFGVFLFVALGSFDRFVAGVTASNIAHGVVMLLLLTFIARVASIPFGLYAAFGIEARFGFNRMSLGLWFGDWVKATLLSLVFAALVSAAALWLVQSSPNWWWLWVWGLFTGFGLLMTFISPYVIEPLFFKVKPLSVPDLERNVQALAHKAGVQISRVFEVDASRRSSHSNAYFSGIGSAKRVVLFDTLLQGMGKEEILAVLAHELGHWRKRHVTQRLVVSGALLLGGLYLGFHLISSSVLPAFVGEAELSFAARALVLLAVAQVVTFPLTPVFSFWSRKHEWEADAFAVELQGEARHLADALVKMTRENLSNLHPHPLYAAFYYSHPPMPERIRKLRAAELQLAR